MNMTDNSLFFN